MAGARVWSADDCTGGPIDEVFAGLRREFPDLAIERLVGTHPADDDNVFWISVRLSPRFRGWESVQVDTYPGGRPPFLLEGDRHLLEGDRKIDEYVNVGDPTDALLILTERLRRRSTGV